MNQPSDRPIKPGERRVYVPYVKGTGDDPQPAGYTRVKTRDNAAGQYATRALADDVLKRAMSHDSSLKGFVGTEIVEAHEAPTLATIKIDDWLSGKVVPIADVPSEYRDQYHDTLSRLALAAYRYGHVVHVNESFRTRAEQEHFWAVYQAGGALAARPGTSPHEHGIGLDVPSVREIPALLKECHALDLIDDVPSEIWHLTNHHRV